MDQKQCTMARILQEHGREYLDKHAFQLSYEHEKAVADIIACRTAEMGGHCEHRRCDCCGHETIAYNSCGNRACPKCGALAKARWLANRREELLPVQYFHVVFTIPKQVQRVALQNRRVVYDLLFKTAAKTLLTIAADPRHLGARIGFTSILHTWGSTLLHHPHIHMIVPGGGISVDGERWVDCRDGFFLPVRVLSRLFRRLFLEALDKAYAEKQLRWTGKLEKLAHGPTFRKWLQTHRRMEWVVYAKPPFGGPEKTLDYLARYTHRTAISDHRLIGMKEGKVSFRYKDYANHGEQRVMTLDAQEFIRRFLIHVPAKGFVRIRHYGLFVNRYRAKNIKRCRILLNAPDPKTIAQDDDMDWADRYLALTGHDPLLCPICKKGRLQLVDDKQELANDNDGPSSTACSPRRVDPPDAAPTVSVAESPPP
jgi:hypothetical protein